MKTASFALSCILVFLVGCASAGKNFDSRQVPKIEKGRTTEPELVRIFGEPNARGLKTGGIKTLTWTYAESRIKGETFIPFAGAFIGGTDTKTKTLVVSLAADGTVSEYEYSGGDLEATGTIPNDPEKEK